ncbi:hypothetical protein [Streptomyces sp. SCL15-4]|uniref:hypothetical protein n=1 Tax=Streptomyces sp. SCL15-4 TaxID=2967221 RepID=UPI00296700B6|nr:hypothetical protein [Streptomyces sp. SCL15-4]
MNEVLTASAGQEDDVDPDRAARGKPLGFVQGVPVYASGGAPAYLRTKAQLGAVRRKPAAGQQPAAYVYARWYGTRIALWDPEESVKMRPLSALQRRQMQQSRTCTDCGGVFPVPVWGMCGVCEDRAVRRRADLRRRTCQDCGTVFQTPTLARSWGDGMCLACDERLERGRRLTRSLAERSRRRCLVQLYPLTVWAAMSEREQAMADWHCPACDREIEQGRAQARRRADRARWDDLGPTIAWAQMILADPEAYAVLDTETTGLTGTSRIVEIAVTTVSGTVLLDTPSTPVASRSRRRPRRFTASPTPWSGTRPPSPRSSPASPRPSPGAGS